MVSEGEMNLKNAEETKIWLLAFESRCSIKAISDVQKYFFATCGINTLTRISELVHPKNISELSYQDIKKAILDHISPKKPLAILERIKFFGFSQNEDEPISLFLDRLKIQSRICQWSQLKSKEPEDELLKIRLLDGLKDQEISRNILRSFSEEELTIEKIVNFIEYAAQVNEFGTSKSQVEVYHNKQKTEKMNDGEYKCRRCGQSHAVKKCPAYGKPCNNCKKMNHFSSMCRMTKKTESHHMEIFSCNVKDKSIKNYLIANVKVLKFQIDTGASISILTTEQWRQIGSPKLQKFDSDIRNFDGSKISTLGQCQLSISSASSTEDKIDFVVVNSANSHGLLGRNYYETKSLLQSIHSVSSHQLPVIKNIKAKIALKEGCRPIFKKARPVPIANQENVKKELDRLENLGIITPINYSEYASPVVWVKKKDGSLRMCADFKVTLNDHIIQDSYPTPSIEEIFSNLSDAQYFAKIDLTSAYNQIELCDEAKKISVINTTKGMYQLNRLQMGMRNSSSIFQRCIEQITKGLEGLIIYQDDILIAAKTKSELENRVKNLKSRLDEWDVTINMKKSIEYAEKITFLGYEISKEGIYPDKRLTNKITSIEAPTNKKELESFIGLINYFGRLIPNFAEIVSPLSEMRKTDVKFEWSQEAETAFNTLKRLISEEPVVKPYSLSKEVTITTDASINSIGSVLTQENHPVIFISRKLTDAERNYSNIEREALAVHWSIKRLNQFISGRKFVIITDHRPLVRIFCPRSATPETISTRLTKWSLSLSEYDYEIKYSPGKSIAHADAMSRMNFENEETITRSINFIDDSIISLKKLQDETNQDKLLSRIRVRIKEGNWSNATQLEKKFKSKYHQLSIEDDIIMKQDKIVVPIIIQKEVISKLHSTHQGISATQYRVKQKFWWPNMSNDIYQFVRNCQICQEVKPNTKKAIDTWNKEEHPWRRLHIDWAYVKDIGNILTLTDAYSGWLEASILPDRSTKSVISFLRSKFSQFGIPITLVSDNAKEFKSEELSSWLTNIGCRQMFSPEYFPQSNGLAESSVKIIKQCFRASSATNSDPISFLHKYLLFYRNSPKRDGKSPSEMMFSYPVRQLIISDLKENSPIIYKNKSTTQPVKASYIMKFGRNTSIIEKEDGSMRLAHDNQI